MAVIVAKIKKTVPDVVVKSFRAWWTANQPWWTSPDFVEARRAIY